MWHNFNARDTARDTVWKRLAEMLAETWTHASGAAMPLVRFALDTGFATQEAYAFVRACRDSRVMAVKGVPRGAALIGTPTAIDVSQGGKKLRRGIKVYTVAVSIAKLEFYNNLRKSADVGEDGLTTVFPAGFVHLPKIDAEFIQQLCAEQLITRRDRNGFPVREWQKMRERNEALDCYVYARAAASAAGLDRFEERHWRELERQLGVASPPPPETTTESINEATQRGGLVFWHAGERPAAVSKTPFIFACDPVRGHPSPARRTKRRHSIAIAPCGCGANWPTKAVAGRGRHAPRRDAARPPKRSPTWPRKN